MENTLIKLLHHGEAKKRAHDSQIVSVSKLLNIKRNMFKADPLTLMLYALVNNLLVNARAFPGLNQY